MRTHWNIAIRLAPVVVQALLLFVLVAATDVARAGIETDKLAPGDYAITRRHETAVDRDGKPIPLILPEQLPVAVLVDVESPELELYAFNRTNQGIPRLLKPLRNKLLHFDFSSSVMTAVQANIPTEFLGKDPPILLVKDWPELHEELRRHERQVVLLVSAAYYIDQHFEAIGVAFSAVPCLVENAERCVVIERPEGRKIRGVRRGRHVFVAGYERPLAESVALKGRPPAEHAALWERVCGDTIAGWVQDGIAALAGRWSESVRVSYGSQGHGTGMSRPSPFYDGYHWLIERKGNRVTTATTSGGIQVIDYGDAP